MIDEKGNIVKPNYIQLTKYAKLFSNLTIEKEQLLRDAKNDLSPHLQHVTDNFYATLQTIPEAQPFLEGRMDALKQTHLRWLNSIFTGPYDATYTESMYNVGDVHVKVNLPVEFMCGGITLINDSLYPIVFEIYNGNAHKTHQLINAVNSVMGFSLFVMQKSYHASVSEELDKFLCITGMSRPLFEKLSSTFKATNA